MTSTNTIIAKGNKEQFGQIKKSKYSPNMIAAMYYYRNFPTYICRLGFFH